MLAGMSSHDFSFAADQAMIYEIRVKGHLAPTWGGWFDGMAISQAEDGSTILLGAVIDQAALHVILKKVRDLGLTLLAVNCLELLPREEPDDKEQNV